MSHEVEHESFSAGEAATVAGLDQAKAAALDELRGHGGPFLLLTEHPDGARLQVCAMGHTEDPGESHARVGLILFFARAATVIRAEAMRQIDLVGEQE